MSKRIEIYRLGFRDVVKQLPIGAEILTVEWKLDGLWFWALVDPDAPNESRQLWIYRTGETIPNRAQRHIGSVLTWDDAFHIFEPVREHMR